MKVRCFQLPYGMQASFSPLKGIKRDESGGLFTALGISVPGFSPLKGIKRDESPRLKLVLVSLLGCFSPLKGIKRDES